MDTELYNHQSFHNEPWALPLLILAPKKLGYKSCFSLWLKRQFQVWNEWSSFSGLAQGRGSFPCTRGSSRDT